MTAILLTPKNEIENEIDERMERIETQKNEHISRYLKIDLIHDYIQCLSTLMQSLPDIIDLLIESEKVDIHLERIADTSCDTLNDFNNIAEEIKFRMFGKPEKNESTLSSGKLTGHL